MNYHVTGGQVPLGLNLSFSIMMFLVIIVIGHTLRAMEQTLEEVGILI
jgi:hypothetical protein